MVARDSSSLSTVANVLCFVGFRSYIGPIFFGIHRKGSMALVRAIMAISRKDSFLSLTN